MIASVVRLPSVFPGWKKSLKGGIITALPLIFFGVLILMVAPPWIVRLTYAGFVAVIVVTGLQVFMGNSLSVNFSHTVFCAIGAYSVAILSTPLAMKKLVIPNAPFGLGEFVLDPILSVIIGFVVVTIIAAATGLVVARMIGVAADIITLCMQIVFHAIFVHWINLFNGTAAFFGIPQIIDLPSAIVVAAVIVITARLFKDSPWGVQLRATAENHLAARSSGVNVAACRLAAWIVGALICCIGGMMFAFFIGSLNARTFYFPYVFLTIAMLILGGMRTVSGAIVGVAIIQIGIEFIRMIENGPVIFGVKTPEMFGLSGIALGAVIVLCMAIRPNGIMGNMEFDDIAVRLWARIKNRSWRA